MSLTKNRVMRDYKDTGLSEKQAAKQLKKFGPNTFAHAKGKSAAGLFFSQFKDILIIILVVSTLLSVLMGEMTEAVAIILIIFINAVLGFVQEYRTEKTLDALKNMAAPCARVIRGGSMQQIPAAEVVPDDVVVLEAGDRVPADAQLVESIGLEADESLLTGESVPVEKAAEGGAESTTVYMGTMVTRGKGRAVTFATGMDTEMGKIAGILSDIGDEQTPLQKRLAELGKIIAFGCLAVCAIVTVAGILRGEPPVNMIITGVSLAVAAVPEGLPAIVTIALALGVRRMLKRNALIRRLPAVETLGCATVICSDKTGTLTQNRMSVRRLCTCDHDLAVTESGTKFLEGGTAFSPKSAGATRLALSIAAVCNNAELSTGYHGIFSRERQQIIGEPTESALLAAALGAGFAPSELNRRYRRIAEIPFDSDRKRMSVIVENDGRRLLFVKGAPDVIMKRCSLIYIKGSEVLFSTAHKQRMIKLNDEMADSALRVLGFAYREIAANGSGGYSESIEKNLVFVGLAGMMDPPRKEAYDAVKKCARAGIKPVMITGDHKNTAAAVARELGILKGGSLVITGAELDGMSDAELMRVAPKASVFARVTPQHKLRIVRAYKRHGNVVAMTGDGVNDAPAVKEADIGVSMGKTGTDVTKEASAVILMDDNFASLVSAIEEGRVIYSNIRKFIRYLLSCNIGEVLTMFIGMLMGLPVVLQPIQILWVNLVTDGLPAIALGLDPPEDDVMESPPRGARESVFSHGLAGMMIFRGCLIGLSTLGSFVTGFASGGLPAARTSAFFTLVLVQLIHVFECKSERKSLFHIHLFNNKSLVFSVLLSLLLILAAIYVPALCPVFGTVPLSLKQVLCVAGYSIAGPIISSIVYSGRKKR